MNWLRRAMVGRYGNDQLNMTLMFVSLPLMLFSRAKGLGMVLYLLAFALLVVCYLRMFSRNIYRRQQENLKFLTLTAPLRQKAQAFIVRMRESKSYCHFACPGCKQKLRVPRGRGKLEIRCPKCGQTFEHKS